MKYVIIGSSAAGISAAQNIRQLDNDGQITILAKDDEIYSRCMLHHFISGERSRDQLRFIDDEFMKEHNINWEPGTKIIEVHESNKSIITEKGLEIPYDKLLIATGSSPVIPSIPGLRTGKQIYTLRNLKDAQKIKEASRKKTKVLVIGAGLVGVDTAIGLVSQNIDVTLVELGETILPLQLDKTAAKIYEDLFIKQGINIKTNSKVSEIILDNDENVKAAIINNEEKIDVDLVVVATGVQPNTSLVKETDIKVNDGIVVDECQQTSIKDIYAAGDVCQSYEVFNKEKMLTPIWPAAVKQGEIAAYNMVGIECELVNNFAIKNSMRFFGVSTISYGLTEAPDDNYQIETQNNANTYQKIIHQNGIIKGAILMGDISNAGVIGRLIRDEIDISGYLNNIFDLTYADFFSQTKEGKFNYNLS
ncbi:NAD(P)/FAD-dependent oxidoreductase [Sporohalobacter salinus]|uniref:NAD(P)/FAD-dependent oxidoreductase n=1 Tax=Sporohalobacter salinus TaxID=1494606 RepID=UPI001961E862|nr:FAD-dependent oxidoreductase [Sporohalobacter salinus]MBM7622599.1 NAD(P)H-nitrite reductase large subunit [Sporohalobacter salinus]